MGGEAQDLRALGAQTQDVGDDGVGVVGVAIVAAVLERGPDLLAQARFGEKVRNGSTLERVLTTAHWPALAAFGGGGGERFDDVRRQAGEIAAVGDEDGGVLVGQQPAAEIGELGGELLVDGAEAGLLLRRGGRAGAHELVVRALEQAQLLGVQVQARRGSGRDRRCAGRARG